MLEKTKRESVCLQSYTHQNILHSAASALRMEQMFMWIIHIGLKTDENHDNWHYFISFVNDGAHAETFSWGIEMWKKKTNKLKIILQRNKPENIDTYSHHNKSPHLLWLESHNCPINQDDSPKDFSIPSAKYGS